MFGEDGDGAGGLRAGIVILVLLLLALIIVGAYFYKTGKMVIKKDGEMDSEAPKPTATEAPKPREDIYKEKDIEAKPETELKEDPK
jgi:hypothetical protein